MPSDWSSDPAAFIVGVPVKVSERFRPPVKVTLPAACNYRVNTEVLTNEYNFSMEESIINWVQGQRDNRAKHKQERNDRIKKYEIAKEERLKQLKEEEEAQLKKIQEEEAKRLEKLKEEEIEKIRKLEEERLEKLREEKCRKLEEEKLDKLQAENETQKNKYKEEQEESLRNEDLNLNMIENVENDESKPNDPESNHHCGTEEISKILKNCPEQGPSTNNQIHNVETTLHEPKQGMNSVKGKIVFPTTITNIQNMRENNSSLLQPTQAKSSLYDQRQAPEGGTNINYAEFEATSDPFDTAALKSINDMEELAKVWQATHIQTNTIENKYMGTPGYQINQTYPNGMYPYKAYNPYTQQPPNFSNSTPYSHVQTPFHRVESGTSGTSPVTMTSNIQCHPISSTGPYYSFNNGTKNCDSQYKPYGFHQNISSTTTGICSNVNPITTLPSYNIATCRPVETMSTIGPISKRPDLEDFYSKYYSNKKNTNSGARSGDSTPTGINVTGSKSLRSCSSVPDLTLDEDKEVSSLTLVQLSSNSHSRSASPARSSSTSFITLSEDKSIPEAFSASTTPPRPRFLDPFTELTSDAQILVQNVSEMGFPRPRVARAVQKLGIDHKKLIEVLLALQAFQDEGNDDYRAELSFYYYMGDIPKVKEFLVASKQLLDLGFEEEKIVELLFKHTNDSDKVLEELIS